MLTKNNRTKKNSWQLNYFFYITRIDFVNFIVIFFIIQRDCTIYTSKSIEVEFMYCLHSVVLFKHQPIVWF